jgi:hypothetical protein
LDSRSETLLNPQDDDDIPSKGLPFLNGKLDPCTEADEMSDKGKGKLEASGVNDDGTGISDTIWPMFPTNLTRFRYGYRDRHM